MCVSLGPQDQFFFSPYKDNFFSFQGEVTNTEITFEQNRSQGCFGQVIQPDEIIN